TNGRKTRSTGTKVRQRIAREPNSSTRLREQLEARTRELDEARRHVDKAQRQLTEAQWQTTEALERQTANAEILKIISSSPTNLQSVLDAVVSSAARFCGADDVTIFELEGQELQATAHWGPIPQPIGVRMPCVRGGVGGRTVLERRPVHVLDLQAEDGGISGWERLRQEAGSPDNVRRAAAARGRSDWHDSAPPHTSCAVQREAEAAARDLRQPSRHRHREHAAAQRAAPAHGRSER